MQIPHFPESNHPIIKSLFHHSDQELLTLFQRHREQGKYFTAIFCRYSPIVYTLIRHSARSPVQAEYLFSLTWRHIYYELGGLDLRDGNLLGTNSFQGWLINMTAICINSASLPPIESIHYDLKAAPPPFWCYLEQALGELPPVLRLMVVMEQTFNWSETRISAYLQAEGESIAPAQVRNKLQDGYRLLQAGLPKDIRIIYLGEEINTSRPRGEVNQNQFQTSPL